MATRPWYQFFNSDKTLLRFLGLALLAVFTSVTLTGAWIPSGLAQSNREPTLRLQSLRQQLNVARRAKDAPKIEQITLTLSDLQQSSGRADLACRELVALLGQSLTICEPPGLPYLPQALVEQAQKLQNGPAVIERLIGSISQIGMLDFGAELAEATLKIYPSQQIFFAMANNKALQIESKIELFELTSDPNIQNQLINQIQEQFKTGLHLYQKLSQDIQYQNIAPVNELGLLNLVNLWTSRPREIKIPDVEYQTLLLRFQNLERFAKLPIEAQIKIAAIFTQTPGQEKFASATTQFLLKNTQNIQVLALTEQLLGNQYSHQKQVSLAAAAYNRGFEYAQRSQQPALIYELAYSLALTNQKQGRNSEALRLFDLANQSLLQLLGSGQSFESQVRSLRVSSKFYRDFSEFLLKQKVVNSQKVIGLLEKEIGTQIETLLSCGKLNFKPLSTITQDIPTLYTINLGDTIAVILRDSQGKFHQNVLKGDEILRELKTFQIITSDIGFRRIPASVFLNQAKSLYGKLLTPLETYLPPSGNLIFLPGPNFQQLPLGMLHDGTQYLIERYTISLGLPQLNSPRKLEKHQFKALIGAISTTAPSFGDNLNALVNVDQEIAEIRTQVPKGELLKNEAFTADNLSNRATLGYPIIHLATHGQFKGLAARSSLYTWDKEINLINLQQIFRRSAQSQPESSLELLILSACQLAQGDPLTQLGLAGLGIQAGARSTMAGLWTVEDESTAQLMGNFYKGLREGQTKAEALRQAQLNLLKSEQFSHPYYWAGWILLGSWL